MQISIQPISLHHYNIFKINPIQTSLFGKEHGKKLIGSATITLDGQNIDLYIEDKKLKTYSQIIGKQTYDCYLNQLEKIDT